MSNPLNISVVIAARNAEDYIAACIESLLTQTIQPTEIIISDDCSDDSTSSIIRAIIDRNEKSGSKITVRLITNKTRGYISLNRTIGTKAASGDYIFFTDADCIANRYWIEEGMRSFEHEKAIGVWGYTFYEYVNPTIADRITAFNSFSQDYATCNIAYRREELESIGFFDSAMKYGREDTDAALKTMKNGALIFSRNMVVIHRRRRWRFYELIDYNDLFRDSEVVFLKRYPDFPCGWRLGKLRILEPLSLLCVFFPPFLLILNRLGHLRNLLIVPLIWIKLIIQRLIILRASIREKVWII